MKIDNVSGNYNPFKISKSAKTKESFSLDKTMQITNEEKDFFVNLYPEQKTDIIDYHFYSRSGKMAGVTVGSLFDRRF